MTTSGPKAELPRSEIVRVSR